MNLIELSYLKNPGNNFVEISEVLRLYLNQGCGANYTGAAPVRTKPGAPKKFVVRCGAAPVQCLLYTLRCGAAPVQCLFVRWAVRCAPVQLLLVQCRIGAP